MKKKKLAAILLALGVCCCGAFGLAACGNGNGNSTDVTGEVTDNKVGGKTYVFSDVKVNYPAGATQEIKDFLDAQAAAMKADMTGHAIVFGENGSFWEYGEVVGAWTQSGNTVTVIEPDTLPIKIKVNGNKLEIEYDEEGLSMTIIYIFGGVASLPIDVGGKIFVFSDITADYPSDYDQALKDAMEAQLAAGRVNAAGTTIVFGSDGTFFSLVFGEGTWTQNGSKVTVTVYGESAEMKVNGNKIEFSYIESRSGLTVTEVYTFSSMDVTGKTFVFKSVSATYPNDVTDEVRRETEEYLALGRILLKSADMTFNADGTVTGKGVDSGVTWTQDGAKIIVTYSQGPSECYMDGFDCVVTEERNGVTITMVYTYDESGAGATEEGSVSGKVYSFFKATATYSEEVTDEEKAYAEEMLAHINVDFKNRFYDFRKDGDVTDTGEHYGTWSQFSNVVFVYDTRMNEIRFYVDGDMIVVSQTSGGMTLTKTYKYNANIVSGYNPNNSGSSSGGNNNNNGDGGGNGDNADNPGDTVSSVFGKGYKYSRVVASMVGDTTLDRLGEICDEVVSWYSDSYTFYTNSVCESADGDTAPWKQSGDIVYIYAGTDSIEITVKDDYIEIHDTLDGVELTLIFEYCKNVGEYVSGGGGATNPDNPGSSESGGGDVANPDYPGTGEEVTDPENSGTDDVSSVSGKTYTFSDVSASYAEGTTDEEKAAAEALLEELKVFLSGTAMTFNEDGTAVDCNGNAITWSQDGNTVILTSGNGYESTCVISGKYLVTAQPYSENVTIYQYYVVK